MEIFDGTDVAATIVTLYGENLVDKLRTDVVTKSQDIVDGFTSTATDKALSANAGKALSDQIGTLNNKMPTFTVVESTQTTGSTGNISMGLQATDKVFVVGAEAVGTDAYMRAWRSAANGSWYLTAVNPNTGAIINNTSITYRYLKITLP